MGEHGRGRLFQLECHIVLVVTVTMVNKVLVVETVCPETRCV